MSTKRAKSVRDERPAPSATLALIDITARINWGRRPGAMTARGLRVASLTATVSARARCQTTSLV